MTALAGAGTAWAHVDPPTCDSTGVSITITVLRNDGVTPVGIGTVNECETVKYRATLSHPGGSVCAFFGGTWSITTPDGIVHDVTPVGGIPCLGGTGGEGCIAGNNSITSALVPYTASPADAAGDGDFDALTTYSGGTAHQSEGNQVGVVSGSTGLTNTPAFCGDGQFCNGTEICDPNVPFGDLNSRLGACVPGITPCADNLFCSNVVCNEATDQCDTTNVGSQVCPDNLFCGTVACNETTDQCDTTDQSTIVCPDNQFCANVVCNEATNQCDTTDTSSQQCPDNLFCANVVCNEATNQCDTTDTSSTQCPDNLFCGIVVCNEDTNQCDTTDTSDEVCPDDPNNECVDNVCSEATNQCVTQPASPLPPSCVEEGSCRMTGGHNYDVVDAGFHENGKVYTTGGQIGAPNESGCCELPPKGKCVEGTCTGGLNGGDPCATNDDCPNDPGRNSHCPWGDWEHNHHSGPDDDGNIEGGSFAFHSGTAASPNEAFIKSVLCDDPGWCVQARPAPFKQIFWEGTGVFHNAVNGKDKAVPLPEFENCASQPVPWSNKRTGGTIHYYRAHVGDFGEPAGIIQKPADECEWAASCVNPEPDGQVEIGGACPSALTDVCLIDQEFSEKETLLHPLCEAQQCSECPDLYEIEIHCTADPNSPIAYKVSNFIREGNFQLHPPVGDSCNPGCDNGVCETGVTGTAETCETCPEDCGPCN